MYDMQSIKNFKPTFIKKIWSFLYLKKEEKIVEQCKIDQKNQIHNDIRIVLDDLKNAENCFQFLEDDDLIDSYSYKIQALKSQYCYLIKKIKSEM